MKLPLLVALFALSNIIAPVATGQEFSDSLKAIAEPRFLSEPSSFVLKDVVVVGPESEAQRKLVLQRSGLRAGQSITLPSGTEVPDAIKNVYRLGIFSDVEVSLEEQADSGAVVIIRAEPEPILDEFVFSGIKKSERNDLRETVPLLKGRGLRQTDVERSTMAIQKFYEEKGLIRTTVNVHCSPKPNNRVSINFEIDRGERVEVQRIAFVGANRISEKRLRRKMSHNKAKAWWRIWRGETFDKAGLLEDVQSIADLYQDEGFYDARVVGDSVWSTVEKGKEWKRVEIRIDEGARYRLRNISWSGNTEFSDDQLTLALGLLKGDWWNRSRLEENLYGNASGTDVGSLYYDRGYVQFAAHPTVKVVDGDSLDIDFDVQEGEVYSIGEVKVRGNHKTKQHVIRRALHTIPGQTFTRSALARSAQELSGLGFFDPASLTPSTRLDPVSKEVDVIYDLAETGSDQIQFSGGWGGTGGLLLQAGLTFGNFSLQDIFDASAWRPVPSGGGQQLSLGVQVQGRSYQNYSLSFVEPWFRGQPRPTGFSLSRSRYDLSGRNSILSGVQTPEEFSLTTARLWHGRRLTWPDDYFETTSSVAFREYNLDAQASARLSFPSGRSRSLTFSQDVSRNSLNDPVFPTSGSLTRASVEVAPPIPGFLAFHKWKFESSFNAPVTSKISIGVSANLGYIGSFGASRPTFERFLVGGTAFDAQYGSSGFGSDPVFMRGYPAGSIGPRDVQNRPTGGTLLNQFKSEVRWMALRSPKLSIQPYAFFDAANTWEGFRSYRPNDFFRSVGIGARIQLPILGMIDINYGRNLDPFPSLSESVTGKPKWRLQFTIGRSF